MKDGNGRMEKEWYRMRKSEITREKHRKHDGREMFMIVQCMLEFAMWKVKENGHTSGISVVSKKKQEVQQRTDEVQEGQEKN